MRHEPLAIGPLDLILDERSGGVAFNDLSGAARRSHFVAPLKAKRRAHRRLAKGLRAIVPVNVEWPDAMNLNDRPLRGVAEHPATLRSKGIASRLELSQCGRLVTFAETEIPGSLHDRNVLVDGVGMRRYDCSGQLANAHHERLPRDVGVTVEELDVSRHFSERDNAELIERICVLVASYAGRHREGRMHLAYGVSWLRCTRSATTKGGDDENGSLSQRHLSRHRLPPGHARHVEGTYCRVRSNAM